MRAAYFTLAAGLLVVAPSATKAQTWTSASTGGATAQWGTDANWTPATAPNAVGASALFTTPTATRTIEVDGEFIVGNVTFDSNTPGGAFTQSIRNNDDGGDTLKFDAAGAGPATVVASGNAATTSRIQADMYFEDSVIANVANIVGNATAGALSLTGNTAGPGGLTKAGDGLLTIALNAGSSPGDQNKNHQGPTTLSGGRTRLSVNSPLLQTSSFNINGGQLTFIGNGSYTLGPGNLNLNGIGPTTGPYAQFGGLIRPETGQVVTVTNNVVLQDDASIAVFGSATSLTMSGVISGGSGAALRQDAFAGQPTNHGTLLITGANTYSGGTEVVQGTFRLSGANATAGTGNVLVDGVSDRGNGVLGSGKLDIQSGVVNAIADAAILSLTGGTFGGQAILGAGINELVGGLVLGGVTQTVAGTYGSTSSTATFQNDAYFSGAGVVTIPAFGQPGDHNEDGFVDAADYVAWRKLPGDFGGDPPGYDAWRENFGEGGAGGGGAGGVPEPGTLMLMGLAAPLVLAGRRRRM